MARAKTVWGIDIGQCALKALKLRDVQGQLEVEEFEVVTHPNILSEPEVDRDQLIKDALLRFMAGHSTSGCQVVISVPGRASFSRFVKLPPVEAKRIPDIVRFEAEQQIPFPINEVIWRYQTFRDPDSPDVEVGIFAMKRSDVAETLHHFNDVALPVDIVQVAPLSLYNFMMYDEQFDPEGATILADVGAEKTDLVVADQGRIWTRTIQIGGNNFTEALVRTFKLSFDKAEELKLSAATSKYARQIFQAMRPVFADLVQEIQRSIGFYTSLHRETRFKKLVGLGNGFRLPGLQKFIEQNLNVSVTRVDTYNKLILSSSVNAPAFQENVPSLAVAYGLALQGLGKQKVNTNLLPEEIVRHRLWKKKRPYFVAAAAVLLAAMFCPGYRANTDAQALADQSKLRDTRAIIDSMDETMMAWRKVAGQDKIAEQAMRRRTAMLGYRDFWPSVMAIIEKSVGFVTPDQPMMTNYARLLDYQANVPAQVRDQIRTGRGGLLEPQRLDGIAGVLLGAQDLRGFRNRFSGASAQGLGAYGKTLLKQTQTDPNAAALDANSLAALSGDALKSQVMRLALALRIQQAEAFKAKPRSERGLIVVDLLEANYYSDLGAAMTETEAGTAYKATGGRPGFKVVMVARTPRGQTQANQMVANLRQFSVAYARWFSSLEIVDHRVDWVSSKPSGFTTPTGGLAAGRADPLMPGENTGADTRFKVIWFLEILNDGIAFSDVNTEPGKNVYELGKQLEMCPEFEPADVMAAEKRIVTLPVGTKLTIDEIRNKLTVPWYRVKAADPGGKSLGAGWVAAVGTDQQLKPIKQGS